MSRHRRQRNRRFNRALERALECVDLDGPNVWKLETQDRYYPQATYMQRLATYRTFTRSIGSTVGVRKP
jgi:hypothetical protein